jgi:hypothetical protein
MAIEAGVLGLRPRHTAKNQLPTILLMPPRQRPCFFLHELVAFGVSAERSLALNSMDGLTGENQAGFPRLLPQE